MTNFWRHYVFVMINFWCHDKLFKFMTCFDVIANFLMAWRVLYVMTHSDVMQCFWRHDVPLLRHGVFLTLWRIFDVMTCLWGHVALFDVITCFWRHDAIVDVMTCSWRHDALFSVITHFLTSWRVFDVLTYLHFILISWRRYDMFWRHNALFEVVMSAWRHGVFLTSQCTFWHHSVFLTSWLVLDVMRHSLTAWQVFDVMTCFGIIANFLRHYAHYAFFWHHDVFIRKVFAQCMAYGYVPQNVPNFLTFFCLNLFFSLTVGNQ